MLIMSASETHCVFYEYTIMIVTVIQQILAKAMRGIKSGMGHFYLFSSIARIVLRTAEIFISPIIFMITCPWESIRKDVGVKP